MNTKLEIKDWEKVKLENIVEVCGGGTPSTKVSEYWNGDIPWLTPAEVVALGGSRFIDGTKRYITQEGLKHSSAKLLPPNSILLTNRATIGEVVINKVPMATNQGFINIIPKNVDMMFFFYWLRLSKKLLNQLATGSTFREISKSVFKKIEIFLPKRITEQKRIAAILSAFDDKIELNNKINQTLEQIAETIFKEWFVKFKFPGWKKTKFVDSELGKIPKGWSVKPLTSVVTINPHLPLKKGAIAPYIEMSDLPTKGMWVASRQKRKYKGGSRFQNGDTLLARITPSLEHGKTGYVNCLEKDEIGFGSTEFIVFRPPNPNWREFVYLLARSYRLRSFAIQNMFGTSGRQRVSSDCFKNFHLVVPPEKLMIKFHQILEPIFGYIKIRSEENQKLAAMRDLLLPKLMRGEIKA